MHCLIMLSLITDLKYPVALGKYLHVSARAWIAGIAFVRRKLIFGIQVIFHIVFAFSLFNSVTSNK